MSRPDARTLSWTVHPIVKDPRRGLLLALAFLLIWIGSDAILGPEGLVLAVVATVVPMAHYLFPNEYRLSEEGAAVRVVVGSGVKPWETFVGYTVYPDGVLLAYDPAILRNRITKGVFLYFDGNRDEVVRFVERHLPGQGYYAPGAGGPPDPPGAEPRGRPGADSGPTAHQMRDRQDNRRR
ncbi:MAG: hypothetical protein IRZ11_05065 [Clostridia bacterium]|nr:hypothetical protein [Clostridia bacterium]